MKNITAEEAKRLRNIELDRNLQPVFLTRSKVNAHLIISQPSKRMLTCMTCLT
jgi:hypothetical protein